MKFDILKGKFSELESKIKKLKEKLQNNLVFEKICEKEISIEEENTVYKVVEIEIEGTFKVGDWKFVATLEHKKNGNIIRKAVEELELPEKFKTCGPYCEHCNTVRNRKDTYVVYNEVTKEFRQVGKTCLQEYTGIEAERVASYFDLYSLLEKANYEFLQIDKEDEDYIRMCFAREPKYHPANYILGRALTLIKENGYRKSGMINNSVSQVLDIKVKVENASDEEINKMTEWVKNLKEDNDYYHNSKLAYLQGCYANRDLALVVSLVGCYVREMSRASMCSKSQFVGNVGDKIVINVKSARVLYTTMYDSYVNELIDEEGNIYIWSTQSKVNQYLDGSTTVERDGKIYKTVGCTIVAVVMEHKEYKGIKQTKITRGKITPIEEELIFDEEADKPTVWEELDNYFTNIELPF